MPRSCNASNVGQAIIDGIVDFAMPVVACYGDVLGDLKLDVLNMPNTGHTKQLYIFVTEISKILGFITPVVSLMNALRGHETNGSSTSDMRNRLTQAIVLSSDL
jgi:hypothetical protein